MFNFHDITKEQIRQHNPSWPGILDHPLIVGGYGSGKANALPNLINHEPDFDKKFFMLKIHMKQNINY